MAQLCVTIGAPTLAALRERRDTATRYGDLVELRLDTLADPDPAGALQGRTGPVIVTCRPTWEGGHFPGSEEARLRLLKQAWDLGAEFVDVEWASLADAPWARGDRLVLSSHDFHGVPFDMTARYAAMLSKNVQATIITPPFTLTARKAGMTTLIDMSELNIPFQLTGLLALRPYLKSNPDVVLSVIRTLSEAIHFYKREKETTLKILGKYLKTDHRDALEETHRALAIKALPEKPYPTLAGIKTILDETALRNPKAKGLKPEDFVDSSFVKKVDDEGLFERLYKK
jgi:ABC-type nitrate/sulfonate/bicarbonate transport system substrate-binding protein